MSVASRSVARCSRPGSKVDDVVAQSRQKKKMLIGIIQSNYLPWRGYFDFIDDVDLFVIYDDMQYTKNDWRNRNRIKTPQGPAWITVPTKQVSLNQRIQDTFIDDRKDWRRKHLESIYHNYHRCLGFGWIYPALKDVLERDIDRLSELNVELIKLVCQKLEVTTPIILSSTIDVTGEKTNRIIEIVKALGGDAYLSGPAAKCYLNQDEFKKEGIQLLYKQYDYHSYDQPWGEFVSAVSVIDLLASMGKDSKQFLKSRRGAQES